MVKMNKLYLFTSDTCPKCPSYKRFMINNNLDCELIEITNDTSSDKYRTLAMKFGVHSVPQFVLEDKDNTETPIKLLSVEELLDMIDNNELPLVQKQEEPELEGFTGNEI